MNRRYLYYISITILLLGATSCGSRKPATTAAAKRYERKPITEVTQEQLNADSRLIEALALQESGRVDEALTAYAELTAKSPSTAAAWYEMSRLLIQRGWTDSALSCSRRAVELNGSNVWYLRLLADNCAQAGDTKGASQTWERIVSQNPEVLEYYYELSNSYIAQNDLPAAVEVLNRVERKIGVTEPISLQKQRLWEAAGKTDKAQKEIEALADAMPQEKRYNAILAQLNMKQRRYAKAKQYYDRILAEDPDDQYIHIQLAEYYKQTGDLDRADQEMLVAFSNSSLDGKTKLQLLGSFYTTEELYGSRSKVPLQLLDQAMSESGDADQFAAFYGDVLMRQDKYPEAIVQFDKALQQDSSQYPVWEAMLVCLSTQTDREEELYDYARRAANLFPTHTLPHYIQALYNLRRDHYDECLKALENPLKWGFSNGYLEADCYALLAEACYRTADYERAWSAFDHYLELKPDDWGTLNNYAYYLSEQGIRLEEALAMSKKTIDAEPDNANSLDTYAWILHLLGRDREGLKYMERAVRLDPSSDTLRRHLDIMRKEVR